MKTKKISSAILAIVMTLSLLVSVNFTAGAAAASITPASVTSNSISFDVVYPTSGSYGNRIELWDSVTGAWSETGNSFYVTNGTYTFSGLVSGRQYMGRLTYLSNNSWVVKDCYVSTTAPSSTYEARYAQLSGSAKVVNGTYVGDVSSTSAIKFTSVYSATAASSASIKIYYATGESRGAKLYVNGSLIEDILFQRTGWGNFTNYYTVNNVRLNSGNNTIEIRGGYYSSWAPDFLKIVVDPTSSNTKEGRNVRIDFDDSYINGNITNANLTRWINHLDAAYDAYYSLVGQKPNGGVKINIIASSESYGWAWIYGNTSTIYWNKDYISGALRDINNNDDWSFGILHEMGHLFDLTDRWNFDAEFWANTKMVYVLETCNAKVYMNNKAYTGSAISNYYKTDASGSYANTLGLSTPKYSGDGLTYKFIEIKNSVSWSAFTKTFKYFNSLSAASVPGTRKDKFDLFISRLSTESGQNVSSMFTQAQINVIKANY